MTRRRKRFVAILQLILLIILTGIAATSQFSSIKGLTLEGVISADTVWTSFNSPYEIIDDVTVVGSATLTIEPGVEIEFGTGTSLIVNGSLYAGGNNASQITFTSNSDLPAPGDWDGIRFQGDENETLTMSFCDVRYAKDGIGVTGLGSTLIEYSNIRDNSGNGIVASGTTSSRLRVIRNSFSSNENGILISVYGSTSRIHNVSITENTFNENVKGVFLQSSAEPTGNASALISNITISSNLMESNEYGIHLGTEGWYGGYILNSEIANNQIFFSHYAVLVNSSSNSYSWISNVTVSGNQIFANDIGIRLQAFHHPEPSYQNASFDVVLGSNIVSANIQGVSLSGDVKANFTRNSIAYNSNGVNLTSSVPFENVARDNDIYRNSVYGMYIEDQASVNASYNYWGSANGPRHYSNPLGDGDQVNGDGQNLDFTPFLNSPVSTINEPPVAEIRAVSTNVVVSQTAILDGTRSTDDGSVFRYFFDFGDGNTLRTFLGAGRHKYASPGVYNVSLVVMDNLGVRSSNDAIETIFVTRPPLNLSMWLNPPSVRSSGQVEVNVRVRVEEEGLHGVFVQLSSNHGGNFEPASGYTDMQGYFRATFFAPTVSESVEVRLQAMASKEGYEDGSQFVIMTVLLPSSVEWGPTMPWILAAGFLLLSAAIAFRVFRGRRRDEAARRVRKRSKQLRGTRDAKSYRSNQPRRISGMDSLHGREECKR